MRSHSPRIFFKTREVDRRQSPDKEKGRQLLHKEGRVYRFVNRVAKSPRFRFSIGSMMVLVTTIGGLLGYVRLKLSLIESDIVMGPMRDLVDQSPILPEYVWLITQLLSFITVSAILYWHRKPAILWFYFVGHAVWFAMLGLAALGQSVTSIHSRFGETFLIAMFFEPSLAFVISIVVCCLALANPKSRSTLAALVLVAVSAIAELSATLAFDMFRQVLAALPMLTR
jgi:hypothetical protein